MEVQSKLQHPRDSAATKARILAAAKQCFSEIGYVGTGIRDIAALAGTSYTMLGRYYGSKAGLLEAALIDDTRFDPILPAKRSEFGSNLAHLITRGPTDGHQIAMTILAAGDPVAREIVLRVVDQQIVRPLADWIGDPHARERAIAIMMLGGGFVMYSRQLPLIANPTGADHSMVRWLAKSFQQIVDEPENWQATANNRRGMP